MYFRFFIALCYLLVANFALADAMARPKAMTAPTIAEYYIEREGLMLQLEIGSKELAAYRNLLPDEVYQQMGFGNRKLAERLNDFFAKDMMILGQNHQPLKGELITIAPTKRIRRDIVTGEPLPNEEANAEQVVTAQLFYPFEQLPQQLTFTGNASYKSTIGFVVYHQRLPVNEFRYLGKPSTLTLNWDDPWYSDFNEIALKRTYSTAMNGFIYVEPFEVRKEIIVRPLDIQNFWLDLGLKGMETIPLAMQDEVKAKVAEFLRQHIPVTINGETIEPELSRVNFLKRTLRSSTVIDGTENLPVLSATLGVIFTYPISELPNTVRMEWDLFSDVITEISTAAVDQEGPFNYTLEPDYNVVEWKNFLKNPKIPTITVLAEPPALWQKLVRYLSWLCYGIIAWLLVICFRAARQNRGFLQARPLAGIAVLAGFIGWSNTLASPHHLPDSVAAGLLNNIYRAFDHRGEEKIYDVLAHSVHGDLLTDIYLETRNSLELANQGGARAKVDSVELQSLATESADNGFVATAQWRVKGSVGHWGHLHQRVNQYSAELNIEAVDGQWKLTGLEILEEQRL